MGPSGRASGAIAAAVLLAALAAGVAAPQVPGPSPPALIAPQIPGASPEAVAALARGEWPTYAGNYASAKYSPLDQITPANVGSLRIAWRWMSPDHAVRAANPASTPA